MHHDSDWNYVNRADQNRVPNLSRARFDYKRKDEDDMAKSTKTYEERIRALEKKEQESIEATKKLIAQRKELEKRKKAEESKKRTHRLCQIGGAVESVLGAPIEEEDIPKLIGFLKKQEANGKFFSKAMQKETNTDMEEV
jgi:outer membrane PBP1 activator LpoA protein